MATKKQLIQNLRSYNFPDNIVQAFERVDRRLFIPAEKNALAYENIPIEIGHGQTTSQPYTIAFMLNLLELEDRLKILEVGSGSGYVLALLNEISRNSEIYGVEIVKELAQLSKERLKNYKNIKVISGNAFKDLEEKGFDRILVSAFYKSIPQSFLRKLNFKGILACVVDNKIVVVKKDSGENKITEFPGFVFVPLVK